MAPTLTNNTLLQNDYSGIYFTNDAGGKAIGNTCRNNKWSGILLDGRSTSAYLAGNQVSGNAKVQIWWQNGAVAKLGPGNTGVPANKQ